MEQPVVFQGGNLQLEGVLHLPEGPGPFVPPCGIRAGPFPGVVVCHPHPRYGGTMDNNVAVAVCDALERAGIASLRFNFRGVGRSQGSYAEGIGEREDVRGASAFLAEQKEVDPARLGLAGYSFGAGVALGVTSQYPALRSDSGLVLSEAEGQALKALALISLPVRMMDLGPEPIRPALRDQGEPLLSFSGAKLLVVGALDPLAEGLSAFVKGLPEPKSYNVVPGADHFWRGHENTLGEMVARFFTETL